MSGRTQEHGDTDLAQRTKRPRRFRVLLHNDDYTTMEFVIEVLTHFFQKSHAEAVELMLRVHKAGVAVAGVYSRDVAETLVSQVTDHAKSRRQPLVVTTEPE